MPIETDIAIWRGNNYPAPSWTLPDEVPLGDSAFFLTVFVDGSPFILRDTESGNLLLDAGTRQIVWAITLDETRRIPEGRIARYELERRADGLEVTEFAGFLIGRGGRNEDVPLPSGGELDFFNPDNSALQLLGWI